MERDNIRLDMESANLLQLPTIKQPDYYMKLYDSTVLSCHDLIQEQPSIIATNCVV